MRLASTGPIHRRTALRGTLLLGAGAVLGAQVSGCASADRGPQPASGRTPATSGAGGSRNLLAYFSRPGENYYYGRRRNLEVGNTQVIAEMIADLATVDVYRMEAADPYPQDYEATVERNVREQEADARPAIANPPPPLEGYDTILLGSPVWNVTAPMIMHTFLESFDVSGKTLFPFVTYAVSGMGNVARDYGARWPDARIGDGLAVRGEEAGQAQPEVEAWLRRIGLLRG
jgi:flavodoxin